MSWRATAAIVVAATTVTAACANDARLLYERDTPEVAGTGGDVPPPITGGHTGSGARFPVGSGGDEPPPPEPVICPSPGLDFCECDPGDYCLCEPLEPEETCTMFCPEGGCLMDCGGAPVCDAFCGASCQIACPPMSSCYVSCGGGCDVVCMAGSFCSVGSPDGPSYVLCEEGAICQCEDPMNCLCEGPGCEPPPGP